MDPAHDLRHLAQTISQHRAQLLSSWMEELGRRSWFMRAAADRAQGRDQQQAQGQQPGTGRGSGIPLSPRLLRQRCDHFLATLSDAMALHPRLELGAPAYREPVQTLSFTAGWMAGGGLGIGEAVELIHALKQVLGPDLEQLYQAMTVVVTEAFMAAVEQQAGVRYRDAMEKSQLVCSLSSRLSALFLVGDPDRRALDEALGRAKMLAVMRRSPAILVDGSALLHPEQALPEALQMLLEYFPDEQPERIITGVPPVLRATLEPLERQGLAVHETLPQALSAAAAACGLQWPAQE